MVTCCDSCFFLEGTKAQTVISVFKKTPLMRTPYQYGQIFLAHWSPDYLTGVPLFKNMYQETGIYFFFFSLTFIKLNIVTAFVQILRHEILIQNQVLFIQPPVERVREHLIAELHIWISNITLLPRIQSSRYQVGMRVISFPQGCH